MDFEVQGFKCKKHLQKIKMRRKVLNRIEATNILNSNKPDSPLPKVEKGLDKMKESIVFSSDLPNVPFYMPRLISRTLSPLKSQTRSRFQKTRVNVFTPQQSRQLTSIKNRRELVSHMLSDSINTERLLGKSRENY
jgi:hypothetical protein